MLNLSIGGPDFMDHPFVDKVGWYEEGKAPTAVLFVSLDLQSCLFTTAPDKFWFHSQS